MKKLTEETAFLSPADKSIVLVKRSRATNIAWMTVHLKNAMFGLRRIASSPVSLSPDELKMAGKSVSSSQETAAAASEEGIFFLHSDDDDVRTTVSLAASAEQCACKPDGSGTITITTAFASGLTVSACSNGNVVMFPPHVFTRGSDTRAAGSVSSPRQAKQSAAIEKATALIAPEKSRLICNSGSVVRYLAEGGPFQKDIMMSNGTRILIRSADDDSINTSLYPVAGVLETIAEEGPQGWRSVILDVAGRVYYSLQDYRESDETNPESEHSELIQSTSLKSICRCYIDAETEALVSEFKDGRVMCISTDDLLEVYFPDGTRFVTHQSGEVLFIDKHGLGQMEIDIGIDDISRRHSRGQKVPIAKVLTCSLSA